MQVRIYAIACAIFCLAFPMRGQSAPERRFGAEAVKKIRGACAAGPPLHITPGRIVLHCFDARQLIRTAFSPLGDSDRDSIPVIGGPAWIDSIRYDIEAKADGANATEMTGPMLLSLLKERFHLETHREPRNTPVYLLSVADGGPKLKPAVSSECVTKDSSDFPRQNHRSPPFCGTSDLHSRNEVRMIDSWSVPLNGFVAALSTVAGRRIVDRTGIAGRFDIHLEFAKDFLSSGPVTLNGELSASAGADNTGAVSLFTAIQKQLGLKLTAAAVPLDVIVIDRVDEPGAN